MSSGSAGSSVARPVEGSGAGRSHRGPETVINPERRPGGAAAPAMPGAAGSALKSSLVRILFPPDDDAAVAAFDPDRGIQLGHFSIVERIRSGGMGAVFRALDTRLNRIVALKVLPPLLSRDPLIVQRFRNEAQSAAQLDHENIARVFFVGEEQGLHFIAFEYVTGTNVRELIQQQGRLPVADAVNFALQIASALVHTSAQGVVHRDIKPSNIIITPSGRAKLVDLGLARKENREEDAADLTMAGTTLGTFDYISPEQARDPRTADVRSDIYSLGCTLYHMLTGVPPFPEGTVLQKLLQHQGDDAPDPAQKNSDVPENLSVVVRKMMAKDPRRRYQNAEQLVRDMMLVAGAMGLRSISPEGLVWLAADSKRPSFWERNLAWMATLAALLLIVGYLDYTSHGNPVRTHSSGEPATGPAPRDPVAGAINPGPAMERNRRNDEQLLSQPAMSPHGALKSGARQVADSVRPNEGASGRSDDSVLSSAGNEAGAPLVIKPYPLPTEGRTDGEGRYSRGPHFDLPVANSRTGIGESPYKGAGSGVRSTVETGGIGDEDTSPAVSRKAAGTQANTGNNSKTVVIERNPDVDIPPPIPGDDEGVFVVGRDPGSDHKYASLEAACAAIRSDGAVIELRFDGRRTETSLKITRKLTIRAAKGRRPVIEFRPRQVVTDGSQVRAVSLPSGMLQLVGVELAMFVEEGVSADQWTLFSVERPDSLRLEGVAVTIVNPRMYPAAIIELRPGAGSMMPPDMPVGGQPRPPLEIEMGDCLFRGQCDLITVRHAEPGRLTLRQCVIAVQGALLSARGNTETPPENTQLELKLEHVTAGLGGGLIRVDSGNLPRKVALVQVFAFDSIFSNAGGQRGNGGPLVMMTGNSPPQDFRKLLMWNGRSNIYERFQTFWLIESTEGTGRAESWPFATWRSHWTEAGETNARDVEDGLWRRLWFQKPFTELTATDFALDRQARNPAVSGATNTNDAGADLTRIPRPAGPVVGDAAERQRD